MESISNRLPLSYAQSRLWFQHRMGGPLATFNIPLAVRLEGDLDRGAMEAALADVVVRHESLRTIFPDDDGVPFQQVLPPAEAHLPLVTEAVGETALLERLSVAAATAFDLAREIPLRAWLFQIEPHRHVMLLLLHHIAGDGWSLAPLARDLARAYAARRHGEAPAWAELPVRYTDYTLWQRGLLGEEDDPDSTLAQQLGFWRQALAGAPDELELPADRPRPPVASHLGATVPVRLEPAPHRRLLELARVGRATLFMVLQAGLAALLSRLGAGEDIVIGTPIAGRGDAALEDLVGVFINTLVLRTDLSGDPSFRELVARVRRFDLEAYGHQDVPFERVVEALRPERSLARHPLFQVLLVLQNNPAAELLLPGLTVRPEPLTSNALNFDLTLGLFERRGSDGEPLGIEGGLTYSSDLFERATAEALAARLVRLLEAAAAGPDRPVHRLEILDADERQLLLERFNAAEAGRATWQNAAELFEEQAARTPEALAVVYESESLSFAQLNARANRLAHQLRELGVDLESRVGLCLDRSLEIFVGLIAILKSGGACVPLDPNYPRERLTRLLEDAEVSLLVCRASLLQDLPQWRAQAVCLPDQDDEVGAARPSGNPTRRRGGTHTAYIMHTSGSTGRPKGVVVEHRQLVRYVQAALERTALPAPFKAATLSPLTADAGFQVLFSAWATGSSVHMPSSDRIADPQKLGEYFARRPVDLLKIVPSFLSALLEDDPAGRILPKRLLILGGEASSWELVQRISSLAPELRILNHYGPTETTIGVTTYAVRPEQQAHRLRTLPIGRPMGGCRAYVLDGFGQLVPVGAPGELYFGGGHVARGYLGRPGLTAERFVVDPYALEPGSRMYRTGDLARWLPDGNLEFLGRADQQVKLRGFRIEPGEIEAALVQHAAVAQAVVVARDDGPGGKQLVAYVVPAVGATPEQTDLRRHVGERLPEHMVPAAFVVLDRLPLTSSGKLDRKALPAPQRQGECYRAPRTPQEQLLCGLFAEVLALPRVGLGDSFFALGGDSILSIQLVSRARRAGLELTPRDVFQRPTVEALAAEARMPVEAARPSWDAAAAIGEVTLTPIMCWLFERGGPIARYNQSMLLRVPVDLAEPDLAAALQALLDSHDVLRMCLKRDGAGGWRFWISPRGSVPAASCLARAELSGLDEAVDLERMQAAARQAEDRLDPQAGRVLQAVWFAGAREGRLLLVIHHLAVDGVSWRILVPDLAAAAAKVARGEPPVLEPVGTPFRVWAQHLANHTKAPAVLAELPAWEAILDRGRSLVPGARLDPARDTVASAGRLHQTLPASLTTALLTAVPARLHARINDVLLAALAVALAAWRRGRGSDGDCGPSLIDLEGHGREPMADDIDLSRTVGWFTSLYPVALDARGIDLDDALAAGPAMGQALKRVKETLRAIPGRGLGYGLLRYLHPEAGPRPAGRPGPQLGFNYLGRFAAGADADWTLAGEEAGLGGGADPAMPLAHLVEVSARTVDEPQGPRLRATWTWAGGRLDQQEVRALAEAWRRALEALVRHAERPGAGGHTPSDFPLVALSQQQVERLEASCPGLESVLPLSPLQEGLLFHTMYASTTPDVYTVQNIVVLEGVLDAGRLRTAAQALLLRHANLRASVHHEGLERPVQVIPRAVELTWREIDLSAMPDQAQQARRAELLAADRTERFMPSTGLPMRWTLLKLSRERHVLVLTNHHILLDGWSKSILLGELWTLYANGGDTDALPRVRPYADYLEWLAAQDSAAALAAWRDYLADLDGATRLAPPGARQGSRTMPERWQTDLPVGLTARLHGLARQRGLTQSTVVQGLWAVLLGRLTGRDDVVFGVTVSGRPAELAGVEQMVGLFINTVPVRVRLRPGDRLTTLLAEIQQSQARLLAHQHVGLAEIQRAAGIGELFDTLVVFENYPVGRPALAEPFAGLRVVGVSGHDAAHYPLSLVVVPGERLHLRLDYDPARFTPETAESIAARLVTLLEAAVAAPDGPLHRLDVLDAHERRTLLEGFNATAPAVPEATLPGLFETQAARTPEAVALSFEGQELTYGELNARANRLAHHLIGRGVGPECLVGIALERSMEMVVALLATLKAGGAYLPLDPDYPEARLACTLADAAPGLVLTTATLRGRLPESVPALELDAPDVKAALGLAAAGNPLDADRTAPLRPANPAYVIYTSGSTGSPKGVVVTHQNVVRLFGSTRRWFSFGPQDVWTLFHSYAFDFSVWELWGSLLLGGRLVVVPKMVTRLPAEFLALLVRQRVTVLNQTPSAFYQLMQADGEDPELGARLSLRYVIFGGEALAPVRLDDWYRRHPETAPVLVNMYGITETTVHVSYLALDREQARTTEGSPIGGNIPDLRVYVLDRWLEPVPVGMTGELYVAGAGLARGYLGRPGLTSERFVADPYALEPGSRMYRTGDLARWLPDGNLEFLGRADHQVKIRGFRIELGEIEAVLVKHPAVAQAAVVARDDGPAGKALVAYVVPAAGAAPEPLGLRRHLGSFLPDYMVPSAFVVLDALPLTSNGKLDRNAMPALEQREETFGAPRTPDEELLCRLFAEVLELDRVGLDDDFFELGGYSLPAMRLVARVRGNLGVDLPISAVFDAPTVAGLAEWLRDARLSRVPGARRPRPD